MNEITPSQAASALAKLSRLNPTRKQIIASRRNGKLGGRPRAKKAKRQTEARLIVFPKKDRPTVATIPAKAVNQEEVTP